MTDDILSDEDKALFRSHMHRVKPLHGNDKKAINPPKTRPKPKPLPLQSSDYGLSDYIAEPVQAETILSYRISGFPAQRFNDLKKGLIPWEARLDLHGLTKDEASRTLCDFIQLQSEQQKRCVLIIHGKGSHTTEAPIIKNQVHRWLPQLTLVQAYHSAQPKDGGAGAVYVLLKKSH